MNILASQLSGEKYHKPYLVQTSFIEKVNAATIQQQFLKMCTTIWADELPFDRFIFICTDAASYMKLAIANLSGMFVNIHHVTCLAHGLSRVCESIRMRYTDINDLVMNVKKILEKSNRRRSKFVEHTGLRLPPVPVITRWGTWIETALFYCKYYDKVKSYIKSLDDEGVKAVKNLKELVSSDYSLQESLYQLEKFEYLPVAIAQLEQQGPTIEGQLVVINKLSTKIKGDAAEKKLEEVLERNSALKYVLDPDISMAEKRMLRYASLVSVDVERSYSLFKQLLGDTRHSFSEKSLIMYASLQFNAFYQTS